MFEKRENLLGLDIGSHAVKMVQLSAHNSALKLVNCGLIPVPRDVFSEGRVSKPDRVAGIVQRLAGHLKIKKKPVAVSMAAFDVMIKRVELPTMTEEQLDSRMAAELGQYIPYNIEEVDVDCQVLDIARGRPNMMEVLLVAAKKEAVSDCAEVVRLAGFEPHVIDVDYFALSNAFEATYGFGEEDVALVDIGASKTIISIVTRRAPVFTRTLSMGGAQLSEAIEEQMTVGFEDAERIKLGDIPEGTTARDLEGVFGSTVRNWVRECERAVDFYYSNYPDTGKIDRVYLSGGSCRIAGLDKVFQEALGVAVEIFNPLARLEYDRNQFDPEYIDYLGPQMAISLGLALRRTKEK